jgi:hypothetical protein
MRRIFTMILLLVSSSIYAQITFQNFFGGNNDDAAYHLIQTDDNGYIICGLTNSYGSGNYEAYLIKVDVNGNLLWSKTIGSPSHMESAIRVSESSDGGYVLVGGTDEITTQGSILLVKLDGSLNLLWSKIVQGPNGASAHSILQCNYGGSIICGEAWTSGIGSKYYAYLVKTDSTGNTLWSKVYGGNSSYEYAHSFQQTSDDGYIVCGGTRSSGTGGSIDFLLLKIDNNGNILWTKTYGSPNDDYGESIQVTSDGGYILAGCTGTFANSYDAYLIKTDSIGNLIWSKTYGGANWDFGYSVKQTFDGGYIISGMTQSFGMGGRDVYVIRTDANGNALWTKTFGTVGDDLSQFVDETNDGGFICLAICDSFNNYHNDICLIKTDNLGNSGCNEMSVSTIVGNPVTTVSFPTLMDSTVISVYTPSLIVGTGCIESSACSTVGINEDFIDSKNISLFPNPTTSELTIENGDLPAGQAGLRIKGIEIYSSIGEKVFSQPVTSNAKQVTISIADFSPGIYFITVTDQAGNKVTKKVVKM